MTGPVLSAVQLFAGYRGVEAVRGLSIRVGAGEIATVIGANGAGKTTLLNALMGILPAKGDISFCGQSLGRLTVEARVELGLSLVPERRELFATMTVEDNLRLGGFRFRGRSESATVQALHEIFRIFPRLEERRLQLAGTLSGGERQMLAMGRALMARPRLLMLDEPSLGLAPLIVRDIFRVVADLRNQGVAILLVEQNARAALQISDHGYVIENGACVLEGPSRQLQSDSRVIESYLGLSKVEGPKTAPYPAFDSHKELQTDEIPPLQIDITNPPK
jgi:branched-chain amino acid transport system ATP-binding protein